MILQGAWGGCSGRDKGEGVSPGGHLRVIEAHVKAPGAAPGAVGVPGQEAVPTAPVQVTVGHGHLDYSQVGGNIQQALHRCQGERQAGAARAHPQPPTATHSHPWLRCPNTATPNGLLSRSRAPHLLTAWQQRGTPSALAGPSRPLTPLGSRSRFWTGCPGGKTCTSSTMCTVGPTPTALCSRPSPAAGTALRPRARPAPHTRSCAPSLPPPSPPATGTHWCPGRERHRCGSGP